MHTTNYKNVFIEVAEDCPAKAAEIPPHKGGEKTVARLQYEMLRDNPYIYTSDDVIFNVHAMRTGIPEKEYEEKRKIYFSKGQACMRSSPLPKRYGWGVHSDRDGKIAIYGVESREYKEHAKKAELGHKKAMRNKKK